MWTFLKISSTIPYPAFRPKTICKNKKNTLNPQERFSRKNIVIPKGRTYNRISVEPVVSGLSVISCTA